MASHTSGQGSASTAQSQAHGAGQNVTRFLVVCGVTSVDHQWFFGNFVGFYRAIESLGGQGAYYNTFPVKEFFDENPTFTDIKFGRTGTRNTPAYWKPIEVYTKWAFEQRQRFWQQFKTPPDPGEESIKEAVQSYIQSIAQTMTSGDIFNVILIGHGSAGPIGTIRLGLDKLSTNELVHSFDQFAHGVRVNLILQSCGSGTFVDSIRARNQHQGYVHSAGTSGQGTYADIRSPSGRYRNSVFTGAWLESLKIVQNPATKQPWSLGDHIRYVAVKGGPPRASPGSWSDIDSLTKFKDVLLTDYTAISFDQTGNTARRVITPPNPAQSSLQDTPSEGIPLEVLQRANEVIDREMNLINRDPPEYGDMGYDFAYESCCRFKRSIRGVWHTGNQKTYSRMICKLLEGLRWRFRVQEVFIRTLDCLISVGLLQPAALHAGIQWTGNEVERKSLAMTLKCYTMAQHCADPDTLGGGFEEPMEWLARVILSSVTEINGVFKYLTTSRILGEFDTAWANQIAQYVETDYGIVHRTSVSDSHAPSYQLGFWLPYDFSGSAQHFHDQWQQRYRAAYQMYENCFGSGSWGDVQEIRDILKTNDFFKYA